MSAQVGSKPAEKPAVKPPTTLRRFVIRAHEYDKVLSWLKRVSKQEDRDDEKQAEVKEKEFTMPADYLPKIVWAHKRPLKIRKGPHGKDYVAVLEKGVWKQLVHDKGIGAYLREALLSSRSDVPMSRDSGYHIVQKRTVGISRRALGNFMKKQEVIQITHDRLPIKKMPGRPLERRGTLEMDLVEAKGRDIGKFVHHPVKDFYWITLIDRLTGWLEVKQTVHKHVKHVAPKLRVMLRRMEKVLKKPITYIRSDSGSEFKGETQDVMQELGIRHKFVKSGNRIENANKNFQKVWYRLMRLGRGDLTELDPQAVAIINNTKSGINGYTPLEALDVPDQTLAKAFNENRKRVARAKYKAEPVVPGDRVRFLIEKVSGKYGKEFGYKSYRGKHWSADVFPVVKYNENTDEYYVAKKWRQRDKLLKVPGVDATTRDRVVAKHRQKKKDWDEKTGFSL